MAMTTFRGRARRALATAVAAIFLLPPSPPVHALEPSREQARSMTISRFGIVATSQTLASQAGAAILERGGSAVDAAIAANAALGVIEPMMNGIGGDLFAIVYDAKARKLYGLNASGWSPQAMSIAALKQKGIVDEIPPTSIYAVTVPGAVAGWSALHDRFGNRSLQEDLAPAIAFAEGGVPVTELDAENWAQYGFPLAGQPGFAQVFLPRGKAPRTGEIFRNPDLANSLRRIASQGRDGFYRGPVADAILKLSAAQDGMMTAEDLQEFQPEWIEPVATTYHGWKIWEMPPNGQGIAALSMLNIMEQFPLQQYGHNSAQALHIAIEAKKLAYADMVHYVADPKFSRIPVQELISKELAEKRSHLIQTRAQCDVLPSDIRQQLSTLTSETTYLTVVDRDGNEVSLIQSNAGAFGSGLVPSGWGFVLHNRAESFTLKPDQANSLAPRKRPLHTIIPAFMQKEGTTIAFGIMGGFNQAQAHAQFVSNIVDFHMNIQAALEASRFVKHSFTGCDVEVDAGIGKDVIEELTGKGHQVTVTPRFSQDMGRGNAVLHDQGLGVNFGASDPRGDGEAVPEEPPLSPDPSP
jgi:gamma-glutamyltranspeptidase/glutathione hydrolase